MKQQLPLSLIDLNEGQLSGLPRNPRKISDKKLERLKKSMTDTPEMLDPRPVIVYPHLGRYIAIGGNMRVLAARQMGWAEIPAYVLPESTPTLKLAEYVIKDNNAYGEDDWDVLAEEWADFSLEEFDKDMPSFEEVTPTESSESGKAVEEDNFDEDTDTVEARCKEGDLWRLGRHKLLCGDATKEEDVRKLLGGLLADLVFTDPPYGMKKENEGVLGDNANFEDLLDFNKKWIPLSLAALKDNGSWYCWGIDEPLMDIYSHILRPLKKAKGADKITFRNLITWCKGLTGHGLSNELLRFYPSLSEKCLFVMKGAQKYSTNKDDYWEGFEPIRQKLIAEKEKAGLSTKQVIDLTTTYASHYFSQSQWAMITEKDWNILRDYCTAHGVDGFREEYDKIREEYDKIREEWYAQRAFFDNTHDNMTDVWEFPRTRGQKEKKRKDTQHLSLWHYVHAL